MESNTRKVRKTAVGLLTSARDCRHEVDAARSRLRSRPGRLLAIVLCLLPISATANEWQSVESIARTAETFVKEHYGSHDDRVRPVAGYLDARLRLARCDAPPEAFVRRGTKVSSRTVVGVRCVGSKPWKVYVPVDVVVTETVLIAKRTLPKGKSLTPADVVMELRDVSMFRSGYLSSVDELVDQRLKRQVEAGRVITPSMLAADKLIRRGQAVTLVVRNDQINIHMAGRALADGVLNQRIRVENTNSGRVVEGIVRSREYVEILVR